MLEQDIADIMAQRVVDDFEAIQIEKHDRQGGPMSFRNRKRFAQPILKQHPVNQAGQIIEKGEAMDFHLRTLSLGDVLSRADQRSDLPVFSLAYFGLEMHEDLPPVRHTKPAFAVEGQVSGNGGDHLRGNRFPIIRMKEVRKGLTRAAKIALSKTGDPIQLLRESELAGLEHPPPIPDMRNALRLFQTRFALRQGLKGFTRSNRIA